MQKFFLQIFLDKNGRHEDRLKLDIDGKKIHTIASLLGVKKPIAIKAGLYELARAIYGSQECPELQAKMDQYMKNEEKRKELGIDKEKWRKAIREKYLTVEAFIGRDGDTLEIRTSAVVAGVGVTGMGSIFGQKEGKICSTGELCLLAREIYQPEAGSAEGLLLNEGIARMRRIEALGNDKEKWRAEIKLIYPTYESFIVFKSTGRRGIDVAGKKLSYLSGTVYGISGNVYTDENFSRLAQMIYFPNGRTEVQ